MSNVFLKLEGVEKSYTEGKGLLPVLQGLDLEIQEGETISIMGASGAGKSTLLHILGTLDPPTRGSVTFEGRDLFSYSEEELAHFRNEKLGFVFQFHHLLGDFTALENIMMPLLLRGDSYQQRCDQATRVLAETGLADKGGSRPTELSGGEQQRVAVARAIITNPVLLLADEPTGNLDSQTGDALMDLLFELNRTRGLTLIYASHNERLAARAARSLRIENGKLLEG